MKNKYCCFNCELAMFDADGISCRMTGRQVPNPSVNCRHCRYKLQENETRVAKCDIFRKKSIRYFCCTCHEFFWDLKGGYRFCPNCGRKIYSGEKHD